MDIIKAKKNAVINVAGWGLPTLIFLILTPIMVDKLGADGFGVIVIIQILTGYMTILNFGFSEAVIRLVASNLETNPDEAMRVMWVGLGLFLVAGTLGAVIIFFLASWLAYDLLVVTERLQEDAAAALRIGAPVFLLQMLAEFYRGIALGCNRFAIPNISRIIRVSTSAIFIVIVLENGGGLTDVMLATLAGLLLGLTQNMFWMQRAMPMYRIGGDYRHVFGELFHFSKHILFSRLANVISSKLSQLMLGTLSSMANVALYEVPVRIAVAGAAIINQVIQVFYPGFSSMDQERDQSRIRAIYFSVLSIQLFLTVPLLIGAILEGPALIGLWINVEFAESTNRIIMFVAVGYFLSSLTNLPTFTAMSFNQPELVSRFSMLNMLVVLATVYPLVSNFGLVGAALVLLLSSAIAIPFMYMVTSRVFGDNLFRELFVPLTRHGAIGSILYLSYELLLRSSSWYHPSEVIGLMLLHYILSFIASALQPEDKRRLGRIATAWK